MSGYNNKSYCILTYEIRYRRSPDDEWNKEYFSTEEDAFEFFKTVYINHWECKMLKIEALESWW